MADDDYSINTNCVVAAVVNHRIQKAGFNWQTSPTRNTADNVVIKTVLTLCEEFERRFEKEFAHLSKSLDDLDLTKDGYIAVLNHLIDGELNWGRVTGVFAFAGAMAVRCVQKGQSEKVDWIREWTSSFLHSRVETWMLNNNGWKGLVEFYGTNGKVEKKNGWGLMAVGSFIGAFALGALIVNRA